MHRIRLAPVAVLGALLLLAGTSLVSGGLILHAARYGLDLARTVRLEQENVELAARLASQAQQLSRLADEMGRLRELEAMIRTISGMESAGEQPLIGTGYGGLEGQALREQLRE
jgi:gamma-glutamyl:cysteine ligase YbdK (ATP-grasp superfamily)